MAANAGGLISLTWARQSLQAWMAGTSPAITCWFGQAAARHHPGLEPGTFLHSAGDPRVEPEDDEAGVAEILGSGPGTTMQGRPEILGSGPGMTFVRCRAAPVSSRPRPAAWPPLHRLSRRARRTGIRTTARLGSRLRGSDVWWARPAASVCRPGQSVRSVAPVSRRCRPRRPIAHAGGWCGPARCAAPRRHRARKAARR